MIHSQVYECFKKCLPERTERITEYFPNGKNSIRVRQANGQEFIFTFSNPNSWKFETIDQFLAGMKGERSHG